MDGFVVTVVNAISGVNTALLRPMASASPRFRRRRSYRYSCRWLITHEED